jgi:hypothetical protein
VWRKGCGLAKKCGPRSCFDRDDIDTSRSIKIANDLRWRKFHHTLHFFTAGLAQLLAQKGIRANAVAPGPIWTPLIPSTMPEDAVINFGKQVPMERPGQPAELASIYVMLADPISSYVSGATVAVTGGKPIL